MAKYYIWTIGCQMNKADSDYVAGYLEQAGYSPTDVAEEADFILKGKSPQPQPGDRFHAGRPGQPALPVSQADGL